MAKNLRQPRNLPSKDGQEGLSDCGVKHPAHSFGCVLARHLPLPTANNRKATANHQRTLNRWGRSDRHGNRELRCQRPSNTSNTSKTYSSSTLITPISFTITNTDAHANIDANTDISQNTNAYASTGNTSKHRHFHAKRTLSIRKYRSGEERHE